MVQKEKTLWEKIMAEAQEAMPMSDLLAKPPAHRVYGPSGQIYEDTSFGLKPARQPRRSAIFLVESRWFDPLILCAILINVVIMTMDSPLDPPGTTKEAVLDVRPSVLPGTANLHFAHYPREHEPA